MSASSTQARKRRLDAAQHRVDLIVEADAAYFQRFPHRSHRVRLASTAETEQNAAVLGVPDTAPGPGWKWFVAVRELEPGIRLRLFTLNDADAECDMSEGEACQVFDFLQGMQSGAADVEARLRGLLAKRGAARRTLTPATPTTRAALFPTTATCRTLWRP